MVRGFSQSSEVQQDFQGLVRQQRPLEDNTYDVFLRVLGAVRLSLSVPITRNWTQG